MIKEEDMSIQDLSGYLNTDVYVAVYKNGATAKVRAGNFRDALNKLYTDDLISIQKL